MNTDEKLKWLQEQITGMRSSFNILYKSLNERISKLEAQDLNIEEESRPKTKPKRKLGK